MSMFDLEWLPISVLSTFQQIVARVSNRVFVGLPMCKHGQCIVSVVLNTADRLQRGLFESRSLAY